MLFIFRLDAFCPVRKYTLIERLQCFYCSGLEMSKWYPTRLNRRAANEDHFATNNTLWDRWCNWATGGKEGEEAHLYSFGDKVHKDGGE